MLTTLLGFIAFLLLAGVLGLFLLLGAVSGTLETLAEIDQKHDEYCKQMRKFCDGLASGANVVRIKPVPDWNARKDGRDE